MKAQTGEKADSRVEAESKLQHKLQCVKEAFQLILSSSLPLFRPARPTASWMNANEMENGNLNGSAQMKRGETMQIYGSSSEPDRIVPSKSKFPSPHRVLDRHTRGGTGACVCVCFSTHAYFASA